MNARQFLLCSINIKDKKIWSELVLATGSNYENDIIPDGWDLLDEDNINYEESKDKDFCYRNALSYARNFRLLTNTPINQTEILDRELKNFTINIRDTSLIVDYHANFLFIICYQTTLHSGINVRTAIESLFKNRSIIENVGDSCWYKLTEQLVKLEVAKYVNSILGTDKLKVDSIELNTNAAFPLFVSEAKAPDNLHELFYNEENLEQRSEISLLSKDYDGSYFHVGWNYTLALSFPKEVNQHVFALMTKMQMAFYKFKHYKVYFNEAFNDLYKNTNSIDSERVDFVDILQLKYHDFLTNYYKFKLGLYPKFNIEMDKVEKLWHMDQDMELMSKTFAAQADFVNKQYNDISQEINNKQNHALSIISFVQVVAFLSVIYDSMELKAKEPTFFWLSLVSVLSIIVVLIIRHQQIGKVKKLRNKRI